MKLGKNVPKRSTTKFPQDLTGGAEQEKRFGPAQKKGKGTPKGLKGQTFPVSIESDAAKRFNP